ncbi:MAG: energy transducer TonB, partial [Pseudomonadota bacterium]
MDTPVKCLLFATALLALGAAAALADDGTEVPGYLFKGAVPIQQAAPKYPTTALREGHEGWVIVNFLIDETGKPADIVITDSAGIAPLRSAAKRAVEGWRFEPATLNGTPTLQCRNSYKINFKLEPRPKGASAYFVTRYKRANSALAKNDLDGAQRIVDALKEHGINNFYENAAYWYLRLQLAAKAQKMEALRYASGRVVAVGPGYLPEDATRQAALLHYKLLIQANHFGEATDLRKRFGEFAIDDASPELTPYHARLEAAKHEIPAYGVEATIGKNVWSIALVKPSFYVEDV